MNCTLTAKVAELAKALNCVFVLICQHEEESYVLPLPRGISCAPERGGGARLPAGGLGAEGMCRGHKRTVRGVLKTCPWVEYWLIVLFIR